MHIHNSQHITAQQHAGSRRLSQSTLMSSVLSSAFLLANGAMASTESIESNNQLLASAQVVDIVGYKSTFKADTLSSPKFTQPLLDTPQTVVVIKKELFEQQSATTLSDALRNTPGITLLMGENGNTATGDSIFMRGFDTQGSIFVDGIRDLGSISRDTFNVEQVEIAKGPAGVDNGRGAASGYVNLSSKTAHLDDTTAGNLTLGMADYKRSSWDVNRALGNSSALRLNVMLQDSGVDGRDTVNNQSAGIAASLAFGLGSATRTSINLLHTQQRNLPDGGVSTAGLSGYYSSIYAAAFPKGNGPEIPPVDSRNFYGSLGDYNDVDATMVTLRIEQDLAGDAVLRNTTRVGRSEQTLALTGVNALVIPSATKMNTSTWEVARQRQGRDQTNQIFTHQTNLTLSFTAFGFSNELSGGAEFIYESQHLKNRVLPWQSATATSHVLQTNANLYHPSTSDPFQPLVSDGSLIDGETTTSALYALNTLTLNPQWEISAGLRAEGYRTQTDQIVRQSTATSATQPIPVGTLLGRTASDSDNLISWKLGGVYKPASNGSIYISYATSQLPPGSANFTTQGAFALNTDPTITNANNANLDPQEGTNQEIGTKWNVFHNKLALTAALFRSRNTNEVVTQPDTSVTPVGERRVQGLELGVAGIVMPNWQISAGLAFMDPKIISGSTGSGANLASLDGGTIQWSPKRTFTLWNAYNFSHGFTLAGGARYVDSQVTTSIVDPAKLAQRSLVTLPEYWVLDAMMAYAVNQQVNLQLNLTNLADETYLSSVNNAGSRYYPGAPRSARLSLNLRF